MFIVQLTVKAFLRGRLCGRRDVEWRCLEAELGEGYVFSAELLVNFHLQTVGGAEYLVMHSTRFRPISYTCPIIGIKIHTSNQQHDAWGYTEVYQYMREGAEEPSAIRDGPDPEADSADSEAATQ